MSPEDKAFYQEQWPHFTDDRWVDLGHYSYGCVWWHFLLEGVHEEMPWDGRICFVVGPNWSRFSVELNVNDYPQVFYHQNLTSDNSTATTEEVLAEVQQLLDAKLPGLAAEAKEKQQEWETELEREEKRRRDRIS